MALCRQRISSIVLAALLVAPFPSFAVNLSTSNIGEVIVAPYYTTRGGWLTAISLTNVGDDPIAVKVRFLEGLNNRDAMNFTVALAGHDVFTGVLQEATDSSGPVFVARDQQDDQGRVTCTIPRSISDGQSMPLSIESFSPPLSENDDGGPSGEYAPSIDRLREGHIQMIVMGYAQGGDAGIGGGSASTIGNAIESFNCSVVDQAFIDGEPNTVDRPIVHTARQFGEPVSVLQGNVTLLNPSRGMEVPEPVIAWANFYNRDAEPDTEIITPDDNVNCASTAGDAGRWEPGGAGAGYCRNLITAQDTLANLEPTLNSGFPAIAHWWDDETNSPVYAEPTTRTSYPLIPAPAHTAVVPGPIQRPRSVDAISLTIQQYSLTNTWSSNASLGVTTDWIITMPTRGFYVDGGSGTGNLGPGDYSGFSRIGAVLVGEEEPYAPFTNAFGSEGGDRSTAGSHMRAFFRPWDRATNPPRGGVLIIPTDVIHLDIGSSTSVLAMNSVGGLMSRNTINVDMTPKTNSSFGTGRLDAFSSFGLYAKDVGGPNQGTVFFYSGMPIIGFSVTQRSFGSVTRNFASSNPHGYRRSRSPVNP